jgi:ABC-type Na+ transport system ATPase subunit NatA
MNEKAFSMRNNQKKTQVMGFSKGRKSRVNINGRKLELKVAISI